MSGNRDVSVGDVAIAVEKLGKGRGTPTQPSFKRIDVKELTNIPGIDKADVDGDGFIDVNELVAVIAKSQEAKSTNKILKYIVFGLILTLLITIGAVVGLTYFIVSTLKDTNVNSSNGQQPVFTVKSGGNLTGLPMATDQLLNRNQLTVSLFYAPMDELRKVEQFAWDQGIKNTTLQAFFKVSGFVRTNEYLRFFTDAGEIVMTPEGGISLEPPAWSEAGIQFYQYQKELEANTTNVTFSGRRSLLSTIVRKSTHPLHGSKLMDGFSVSPEALENHPGRMMVSTTVTNFVKSGLKPGPADIFISALNSLSGFVDCGVGKHSSDPYCYYCQGISPLGGMTPAGVATIGMDAAGGCKNKGYSSSMAEKVFVDSPCSPGMRMGGIFENPPAGCPGHKPGGGCFPASATVLTTNGMKMMGDLEVGDKVQTVNEAGKVTFEDVHLFGHKDGLKVTEFVGLITANQVKLLLTPDHFVPIVSQSLSPSCYDSPRLSCAVTVPASWVKVGDIAFVVADNEMTPKIVTEATSEYLLGRYNPYTLGGKIVVDGVLASAHSAWFLDSITPVGLKKHLPKIYQAILTPVRLAYFLLPQSTREADTAAHSLKIDGWNDMSAFEILSHAIKHIAIGVHSGNH